MDNVKMFDPFEGAVVCNCEKIRPDVIGRMIPTSFTDEDEPYTCRWCRFIREFGIVEELANIEKKVMEVIDNYKKRDKFIYNGLEYLEDWGAFSDEGIMSGCHSGCDNEMQKEYLRNYEEYYRMRRFYGATITFARETLNLSVKELSESLELPEYIINNLELGTERIIYDLSNPMEKLWPVRVATPKEEEEYEHDKKWWEGKSDDEIEKKIQEFLLKCKNIEK